MRRLWFRLRAMLRRLLGGDARDEELSEEIRAYVEHDTESKIRSGMTPEDARRAALIELGGAEQVKERVREDRAGAWWESIFRDIRYALRSLGQARAFSATVIGSLSLGLAAMILAFAMINGLMQRPLPGVQDQDRLVEVGILNLSGFGMGTPPNGMDGLPGRCPRSRGDAQSRRSGQLHRIQGGGDPAPTAFPPGRLRIAELLRRVWSPARDRTHVRSRGRPDRIGVGGDDQSGPVDARVRRSPFSDRTADPGGRPDFRHHRRRTTGIRRHDSERRPLAADRFHGSAGDERSEWFEWCRRLQLGGCKRLEPRAQDSIRGPVARRCRRRPCRDASSASLQPGLSGLQTTRRNSSGSRFPVSRDTTVGTRLPALRSSLFWFSLSPVSTPRTFSWCGPHGAAGSWPSGWRSARPVSDWSGNWSSRA